MWKCDIIYNTGSTISYCIDVFGHHQGAQKIWWNLDVYLLNIWELSIRGIYTDIAILYTSPCIQVMNVICEVQICICPSLPGDATAIHYLLTQMLLVTGSIKWLHWWLFVTATKQLHGDSRTGWSTFQLTSAESECTSHDTVGQLMSLCMAIAIFDWLFENLHALSSQGYHQSLEQCFVGYVIHFIAIDLWLYEMLDSAE